MTDTITRLIEKLAHIDVTVTYENDPQAKHLTQITITGPTSAAVQRQIERVMAAVERDGGFATFHGPSRMFLGYGAIGTVVPTSYLMDSV